MIIWSGGRTRRRWWTIIMLSVRRGRGSYHGWTSGGDESGDGAIWLDRWPIGPIETSRMYAVRDARGGDEMTKPESAEVEAEQAEAVETASEDVAEEATSEDESE